VPGANCDAPARVPGDELRVLRDGSQREELTVRSSTGREFHGRAVVLTCTLHVHRGSDTDRCQLEGIASSDQMPGLIRVTNARRDADAACVLCGVIGNHFEALVAC
jgi:hypothetical protein